MPQVVCVAGCCGGGHVKWCHEVAKASADGIHAYLFHFSVFFFFVSVFLFCFFFVFLAVSFPKALLRPATEILGPKMARSRRSLKSICPMVPLQISSHAFFQTQFEKTLITPPGYGDSGTPNGTVPEEAKIHLSYGLFANFMEHIF